MGLRVDFELRFGKARKGIELRVGDVVDVLVNSSIMRDIFLVHSVASMGMLARKCTNYLFLEQKFSR